MNVIYLSTNLVSHVHIHKYFPITLQNLVHGRQYSEAKKYIDIGNISYSSLPHPTKHACNIVYKVNQRAKSYSKCPSPIHSTHSLLNPMNLLLFHCQLCHRPDNTFSTELTPKSKYSSSPLHPHYIYVLLYLKVITHIL